MTSFTKKLACFFACKRSINCRALKIKRAWDEVEDILNTACCKKRKCK